MKAAYFALAFGSHGCIPDSHFGAFKVTQRHQLTDALRDAIEFYELPKAVLGRLSIMRTWRHAKRHGLSSVSLELATPTMHGCLMFMGLTEAEYDAAIAAEDDGF